MSILTCPFIEETMDNLDRHLIEHPTDYQAVIHRLKKRSKDFEYAQRKRQNERLKKVAEYRRMLNEK